MSASRRRLLLMSLAASGSLLLGFRRPQAPAPTPQGRPPRSPTDSAGDSENPLNAPSPGSKAILEQRQKDIKKQIEKLYDLASQLKAEVEKTDATVVLSLAMVKKAEEIEKLAKHIKENAKG
jgi:hypothetical protein